MCIGTSGEQDNMHKKMARAKDRQIEDLQKIIGTTIIVVLNSLYIMLEVRLKKPTTSTVGVQCNYFIDAVSGMVYYIGWVCTLFTRY